MSPYPSDARKFITIALTTGDAGAAASLEQILMKDVNIHVYGAAVFYGDAEHVLQVAQSSATPTCSIIQPNAVVWFENLLVSEAYFKSFANAVPGYVVITGTV